MMNKFDVEGTCNKETKNKLMCTFRFNLYTRIKNIIEI